MPLNLTDVEGHIQRMPALSSEERYRILPKHPAFQWLNHICLSLSAMTSAISTIRGLPVGDGDYLGLSCIALDYVLSIPVSGCVKCALENDEPGYIEVTAHEGKRPERFDIWAAPLRAWLQNIMWPGFIHFFETNDLEFPCRDLKLIVDALRNAYAHGGVMSWPDQRPAVNWHGISLDRSVHKKKAETALGYSDVLALMLLISNEILAPAHSGRRRGARGLRRSAAKVTKET